MKLIAEYLDQAIHFEALAEAEADPNVKARLMDQAKAHRKLAADRAKRLSPRPARGGKAG